MPEFELAPTAEPEPELEDSPAAAAEGTPDWLEAVSPMPDDVPVEPEPTPASVDDEESLLDVQSAAELDLDLEEVVAEETLPPTPVRPVKRAARPARGGARARADGGRRARLHVRLAGARGRGRGRRGRRRPRADAPGLARRNDGSPGDAPARRDAAGGQACGRREACRSGEAGDPGEAEPRDPGQRRGQLRPAQPRRRGGRRSRARSEARGANAHDSAADSGPATRACTRTRRRSRLRPSPLRPRRTATTTTSTRCSTRSRSGIRARSSRSGDR